LRLRPAAKWLNDALISGGHEAVVVFIVISGYCLMKPVACDAAGAVRGGFTGFMGRRARRILPTYYAAVAMSLLLVAAVPAMNRPSGGRWDVALPALRPGVVLSHLLFLHNTRIEWVHKLNPPMWSLATEWQIYLTLPLLAASRRRLGMTVAVAIALAAGYEASVAVGSIATFSCPWFLGLFAVGAAAADLSHREGAGDKVRTLPWGTMVGASLLAQVVLGRGLGLGVMESDLLLAMATGALLVRCSLDTRRDASSLVARALGSSGLVGLGAFSYSLYLTHYPLLSAANLGLRSLGMGPMGTWYLLFGAVVPLCVLVAYGFSLAFERPFLPSVARTAAAGRRGPFRTVERVTASP
jgi:peptidoglycan/LPS O-acetylase OafA/YrhL